MLRDSLRGISGWLYLEFEVPRLGSRIDAVLVVGAAVIVIEFKVGEDRFQSADLNQTWDYALDLKNFHEASHDALLFPILVATDATSGLDSDWSPMHEDGVHPPRRCARTSLAAAIQRASELCGGEPIDPEAWGRSHYRPTPSIIEAARALYARHSVDSIARNDAGAKNLAQTLGRVEELVDHSQQDGKKTIVFVTGVPGAGKTLVGLSIATHRRKSEAETHAVYLSGNGPLVDVLRAALTRDEHERLKRQGERVRKGVIEQKVKPFIQNVHHFRDEGLRDEVAPPIDHVVIFDEAQRAWNVQKTADFMRRRKNRPNFSQSEPEFLLSYMDRHTDWAVVVCLVGGGQEIHTGEAGIGAWLDAIAKHFPAWKVHVSTRLADSEYAALGSVDAWGANLSISREPELHLNVSMRSFRAESVSGFVKAALDGKVGLARSLLDEFRSRYPVVLTRDLQAAKDWTRGHARGSERYGLVASSQAQRLKPHAIDVRVAVDPVKWFLNDSADTRSSYYLEDAATEFQVQGLELDWICMSWDADLRKTSSGWSHHQFHGRMWKNIKKTERQQYLVNAYRVLLTRARQGMVIFVPDGAAHDNTRRPEYYDNTYAYLQCLGLTEI